jgi:hypothetical protein
VSPVKYELGFYNPEKAGELNSSMYIYTYAINLIISAFPLSLSSSKDQVSSRGGKKVIISFHRYT